jgi:hypothetical protein
MGMISSKLLPVQSAYNHINRASSHALRWISGLVTQLLQVTHTQWMYRCVLVHDLNTGTLISAHKAKLLKEIKHQLALGTESLDEEDRFLLECNFNDLTNTTGEHQEYWLSWPSRRPERHPAYAARPGRNSNAMLIRGRDGHNDMECQKHIRQMLSVTLVN